MRPKNVRMINFEIESIYPSNNHFQFLYKYYIKMLIRMKIFMQIIFRVRIDNKQTLPAFTQKIDRITTNKATIKW